MARQFLTGLNLNKNELLNAKIQNLPTSQAPSSPVTGQIFYDTDVSQLKVWNGTSWLALAAGGNVQEAIDAAIAAADTDDIDEGASNLYYTESRAKTDAAELLTGATKTNITITGDGSGLTITAENGVADSTTDDLDEGTTNKYFTDERAQDAVGNAVGTGLSYNDTTGAISVTANTYDAYGSASAVAGNLTTHINDTSAHGTTGDVVGTSDSQTLTNKTLGTGTVLSANVDANQNKIVDLADPTDAQDAATKTYVDTEISDHADDVTGVHGVTGNVVGTTDTQTLTDKTLGADTSLGADLNAAGYKITGLGTPTADGDAATKAYVDSVAEGLHVHASVAAATTANVDLTPGNAPSSIDGVTLTDQMRILVKSQTAPAENGIYYYDQATDDFVRTIDYNTAGEIDAGDFVFVDGGNTYGNTGWVQTNNIATLGTDAIDWVQFSGAGVFTAGDGLTIDGTEFNVVGTANRITVNADSVDIASTYVGQSSITTLGTITTGVWNGTDIAVADGGTGSSTAAGARANLGATTKYTEANPELTVSSGEVTWTVTHNLGIRTVVVQVYDTVGFDSVEVDVERTNTNTVTLQWPASATVDAGKYQVVIVG